MDLMHDLEMYLQSQTVTSEIQLSGRRPSNRRELRAHRALGHAGVHQQKRHWGIAGIITWHWPKVAN
jgi:hypothetical protein